MRPSGLSPQPFPVAGSQPWFLGIDNPPDLEEYSLHWPTFVIPAEP